MDSTSVSLLLRLKQPSESALAWERFVELYAPLIFRWAEQRGLHASDASDLTQDVMATLVTKLAEFEYDPSRNFRGWLRTITINKANDYHRRNAVRAVADLAETNVAAPPTEDLFDEVEYRSFLANRALEIMQAEFRQEVWQAAWKQLAEDKTAAEVAEEMAISRNMAYLAKSRVLARLREELSGLLD